MRYHPCSYQGYDFLDDGDARTPAGGDPPPPLSTHRTYPATPANDSEIIYLIQFTVIEMFTATMDVISVKNIGFLRPNDDLSNVCSLHLFWNSWRKVTFRLLLHWIPRDQLSTRNVHQTNKIYSILSLTLIGFEAFVALISFKSKSDQKSIHIISKNKNTFG